MKVVPASEIPSDEWDDVCDRSGCAWLFHRKPWLAIEERFHGHRSLSFAVRDESGLVGVHPLYVSEVGIGWFERLVHSGIHRHTGFAPVDNLPPDTARLAWNVAMRAILETAAAEGADRIQLNAQNLAPLNRGSGREEIPVWVREFGFNLGLNFGPNGMLPVPGMATCCADQIVELDDEEAELFGRLSKNCRGAVRQAQKSGVEFELGDSDGSLADYWRLANLAAQRTGEVLPPRAYFETLVLDLHPQRQCEFVFARHRGIRVAAALLVIDKGAVSYLGGVSDPEYLPMRVNNFVQWSVIAWARSRGLRQYRLGPAFPEVPDDWPIARVSRFKTKFGGRSVTTIQGSYFLHPEKYHAAALDHLTRLCSPGVSEPRESS